jgi:hypothetical protein
MPDVQATVQRAVSSAAVELDAAVNPLESFTQLVLNTANDIAGLGTQLASALWCRIVGSFGAVLDRWGSLAAPRSQFIPAEASRAARRIVEYIGILTSRSPRC